MTHSIRRIAVLASGGGSNLQAILDRLQETPDVAEVVWVGANRADAGALARASAAGIATHVVTDHEDGTSLLAGLDASGAGMLVLAGYLKRVPANVVQAYHGRLLNVHPALLPAFGGEGMYGKRVHSAVIAAGARVTGVTVHWVNDEYDRGAIIAQWPVAVHDDDTAESLAERVLRAEHRLLPLCVAAVASGELTLGADGRTHGAPSSLQADFLSLLPR